MVIIQQDILTPRLAYLEAQTDWGGRAVREMKRQWLLIRHWLVFYVDVKCG
jgi:hypothetical protein